jgi:hypothetical protein
VEALCRPGTVHLFVRDVGYRHADPVPFFANRGSDAGHLRDCFRRDRFLGECRSPGQAVCRCPESQARGAPGASVVPRTTSHQQGPTCGRLGSVFTELRHELRRDGYPFSTIEKEHRAASHRRGGHHWRAVICFQPVRARGGVLGTDQGTVPMACAAGHAERDESGTSAATRSPDRTAPSM